MVDTALLCVIDRSDGDHDAEGDVLDECVNDAVRDTDSLSEDIEGELEFGDHERVDVVLASDIVVECD